MYALPFYLDAMAEHWDAIIEDDYVSVMPLTWKSKFGIRYLYQPPFIQQGGIFSPGPVSMEKTENFLQIASVHFAFAEITLNHANAIPQSSFVTSNLRNNYILDFNRSYDQLFDNYSPAFTKSLRRIQKFGLSYRKSDDADSAIKLYQDLYGKSLPFFPPESYANFNSVANKLQEEQKVEVREVYSSAGELVASVLLINDGERLYNVISNLSSEGRRLEANYFLYDQLLREFAGRTLMFDFEGSDIKGIAAFYKKFNPVEQPYPFVKWNKLPAPLRIFKR